MTIMSAIKNLSDEAPAAETLVARAQAMIPTLQSRTRAFSTLAESTGISFEREF